MIEHAIYDGFDLADIVIVADVQRGVTGTELSTQVVSGRDGVVVTGARYVQPDVTALLVARDADVAGRREIARQLGAALLKREPKVLSFSSDGELYYKHAIVRGLPQFNEFVRSGSVLVTWAIEDGVMYGKHRSVAMTGEQSIIVYGTHETPLKISGTATPASGLFGVQLESGEFVRVPMTEQGNVVIDSESRTCMIGEAAGQITLESDWLVLPTGNHTLAFDSGSGNLTLEWDERWL